MEKTAGKNTCTGGTAESAGAFRLRCYGSLPLRGTGNVARRETDAQDMRELWRRAHAEAERLVRRGRGRRTAPESEAETLLNAYAALTACPRDARLQEELAERTWRLAQEMPEERMTAHLLVHAYAATGDPEAAERAERIMEGWRPEDMDEEDRWIRAYYEALAEEWETE